jgi:hypothetical protein
MKKITFLLLLLLPALVQGQYKKFELGITAGNNGQFEKILNDFYNPYMAVYFMDDIEIKSTDLKYTLSARCFFSENISGRLKAGIANKKEKYSNSEDYFHETYEVKQSVINFNPSLCYSKSIDKFEIMTGLELPLMFVGEMNGEYEVDDDFYSESGKVTMPGGFIFGINGFLGLKYYFNSWFGIGSEINYGLLSSKIDGEITSTYTTSFEVEEDEFDASYKKTYFSSPEFSFGIFLKPGKQSGNTEKN